ncbi:hypothetical protein BDR26DRAFT_831801 [Obelidium mucronatum]|nr:hypothetical protein BDR26DRAFT_831801 [Obelidium mucronatum]
MTSPLTTGRIYALANGAIEDSPCVLQVLNVKKMNQTTPGAPERWKLILSDGYHGMQGMLATQLNPLAENGTIVKHSIVQVNKLLCNQVAGKLILIILEIECLNPGVTNCERIGNPGMDIQGPPPTNNAAPPQQQQHQQQPQQFYNQQQPAHQQQKQQQQPYQQAAPSAPQHNQQFQQQRPAMQQQQQRQHAQPHQSNASDVAVFPIKSLSPYQNKWTIRARVVNKSDIRTYNNAKGPGQLFSVTFGDDSGEIRATGFNDVVTQFYDMLVINKVYYVSKAAIKIANKQFSGGVNNDYEMTLDLGSMVTECNDGAAAPQVHFRRVMLDQLGEHEKDAMIDVVAVVTEVNPVSSLTTKAGKQLSKRDVTIADESGHSCRLTLWGAQAESFADLPPSTDGSLNPVYVMKGLRVGDFGGRSLSVAMGASLLEGVDCREVHGVKGWWLSQGVKGGLVSSTGSGSGGGGGERVTGILGVKLISKIAEENLGHGEKADWLSLRVTVAFIKADRLWYPACQSEGCQKKVVEADSGWRCEKCQKAFPSPKYRYMMSCKTIDASGEQWISFFNDTAETLLGVSANELQAIQETDEDRFNAIVQAALWKQVTVRANCKVENFGDEGRLRVQGQSLEPINFAAASHDLADAIATFG